MIQTFCDVCKKQIGVEVSKPGQMYSVIPCENGYYNAFGKDNHAHVCCECEGKLRQAILDAMTKIKTEL